MMNSNYKLQNKNYKFSVLKRCMVCLCVAILFSGCAQELQASVVFEEVWEDLVDEFQWGRRASFSQEEAMSDFSEWADVYEVKRAKFIRRDDDEGLRGSTIILGKNIAQNIEQMTISLKKLQEIEVLQDDNKELLKSVCGAQKSSVDCGL